MILFIRICIAFALMALASAQGCNSQECKPGNDIYSDARGEIRTEDAASNFNNTAIYQENEEE